MSQDVRSYVEMNMAALAQRKDGAYRVWLICHHLSRERFSECGRIPLKALRAYVSENGPISRQVLARVLHEKRKDTFRGEGVFWFTEGKMLRLAGYKAVADALGVDGTLHRAFIPLHQFATTRSFRAALLGSWFHSERRISSMKLAEKIGRSRRTCRYYLKTNEHVQTRERAMLSVRQVADGPAFYWSRVNGQWRLLRRLSNAYTADYPTASPIKRKRASTLSLPNGASWRRLYFEDPAAAAKACEALLPGEQLYLKADPTFGTDFHGRELWHGFLCDALVDGTADRYAIRSL